MLKYFRPIAHKKDAPEDKDPPEGKELSNLSWPYLLKVIPPSSLGVRPICQHNFGNNRMLKEPGIMLE